MMPMMALTVRNPFAVLIAHGFKPIENRQWSPTKHFGDQFAIHAGAEVSASKLRAQLERLRFERALPADVDLEALVSESEATAGKVVAVVRVNGLHRMGDPITEEAARWRIPEYRFGWHLVDVVRLAKPLPAVGRLGLWPLPIVTEDLVRYQLEGGRGFSASIR